ncbi:MAG: hypothetical protein ACJ77M_04275 [Thermoleophilaceae bacterium]
MCLTTGCQTNILTLTNLDLEQLDASTGTLQAQSNSAIDNVEQVRSPATGQVIYKVKATSNVDGLSGEPFALAATNPVTPLATPQPTVNLQVSSTQLKPGQTATVTATVQNPSADLTGQGAQLALTLPAGLQIVSGAQTQSLGTLATNGSVGDSGTATWTVKATTDVVGQIAASATASRYGETFTSTAATNVSVDGTPPWPTVATPSASTTSPSIPVSWGATDAVVGVDHYDVEVSQDGGPFLPWLTATTATSGSYTGAPGHAYAFRVRAVDRLGNLSGYAFSSALAVVDGRDDPSPPDGGPQPPPPSGGHGAAPRTSPGLHLSSAKRTRSLLLVIGTVARRAAARIVVTYTVKVGRRTYRLEARAKPTRGRFKATVKLPAAARHARRGTLRISYAGDRSFRNETVRTSVTAGR